MYNKYTPIVVLAVLLSILSTYSIIIVNKITKPKFEWYSQYYLSFKSDVRICFMDEWKLKHYPEDMLIEVFRKIDDLPENEREKITRDVKIDSSEYVYIYCSLGEKKSYEYRIRVLDVAQRHNTVEVLLSMNSPTVDDNEKIEVYGNYFNKKFYSWDLVRIKKDSFPIAGRTNFVFKDQNGWQICHKKFEIIK